MMKIISSFFLFLASLLRRSSFHHFFLYGHYIMHIHTHNSLAHTDFNGKSDTCMIIIEAGWKEKTKNENDKVIDKNDVVDGGRRCDNDKMFHS